MLETVKKLFNDSSKDLKRINKLVDTVNGLESKYEAYSDEELRGMKDQNLKRTDCREKH